MTQRRFARGLGLLFAPAAMLALVVLAPLLTPNDPSLQSSRWLNAPPTGVHVRDSGGAWRRPFIYRLVRVDQLEQRYAASKTVVPLVWLQDGRLLQSSDAETPFFLLGADGLGRDVFSRLLFGARTSLALAVVSTGLALAMGALVGAVAGYRGGLTDECLMRGADVILLLPGMYAALVLRALLPPVLPTPTVFALLTLIFAVMGAPLVARGVRGIVRAEREQDYVVGSRALGADTTRIATRHLLPQTMPFLMVQATLLVPAFIVGETTFSYVGLGFPDTEPTWGTMLLEASSARALADFPWLLAPVVAIFVVVVTMHLVGRHLGGSPEAPLAL